MGADSGNLATLVLLLCITLLTVPGGVALPGSLAHACLPRYAVQVVELKPFLKFDHALKDKPDAINIEKRVNIEMKNITIPRLMNDTTSECYRTWAVRSLSECHHS